MHEPKSLLNHLLHAAVLATLVSCLGGCGGTPEHVDTGYGVSQSVPKTVNCTDLCQRLSNCTVNLCDEDRNTTQYLEMESQLDGSCAIGCDNATLASQVTSSQWTCMFDKSCRAVFSHDACGVPGAFYKCP